MQIDYIERNHVAVYLSTEDVKLLGDLCCNLEAVREYNAVHRETLGAAFETVERVMELLPEGAVKDGAEVTP